MTDTATHEETAGLVLCDGCGDVGFNFLHVSWVHHDNNDEGWVFDNGERVKGRYCSECVASIRRVQRAWNTATTYTVRFTHEEEVVANSEQEALSIAFAMRAKLNVRDLRVSISDSSNDNESK